MVRHIRRAVSRTGGERQLPPRAVFFVVMLLATACQVKDSLSLHAEGVAFDRDGKENEALTAYQAALKLNERHFPSLFNLGNLHFRRRNYKDARIQFIKAISVQSNSAEAWFNLGLTYLELGERLKAAECFRLVPEDSAVAHEALLNQAALYVEEGKQADALRLLSERTNAALSNAAIRGAIGNLLLARGERDEGLVALADACRLAPLDPNPRRRLAEAYLRLGFLPAARTNIDALRPLPIAPGTLALLEAEYRLAGGQAAAVLPDLTALHEEWPDDYDIAFVLGRCLEILNRRAEALVAYRRAANIEFRRKEPRLAMARLHIVGREEAQARSILEYLARYHPEDRDVLSPLLRLYYDQGYLERALRIGQRLLAIAPAETNAQILTGISYLRIEDPARRDLKKGVELLWPRRLDEPRNRSLLEALHYGLLEMNEGARAAEVKMLFP